MKVRDLLKYLRENNCAHLRTTGSHAIFQLPNGHTLTVVVNHPNADASRNVMASARRLAKSAGLPPIAR